MVPIGMAFAAPPKRQAAIKLAAKTILRIGSSRVHTLTDCGAVLEPFLKSAFICASAYVDLMTADVAGGCSSPDGLSSTKVAASRCERGPIWFPSGLSRPQR
jgi:hypothetical protein